MNISPATLAAAIAAAAVAAASKIWPNSIPPGTEAIIAWAFAGALALFPALVKKKPVQ